MNKIMVILTSPLWIFLAGTDYLDLSEFIKALKKRYTQFSEFKLEDRNNDNN